VWYEVCLSCSLALRLTSVEQDSQGYPPVPTLVPQGFIPLINCSSASCICDASDTVRGPTTSASRSASLGACAHHRQLPMTTCAVKIPYCTSAGLAPVLTPGLGFDGASVRYVAPCSEVPCSCRPLPDGNHACYSIEEATTSTMATTTGAATLAAVGSGGYFCQAQDAGCVWDEQGPTFASDPTNKTFVTEIALTSCTRCKCSSTCEAGACAVNPNDIDCVDYLGQRPVASALGSGFTISCQWCACASGQPACGSLADPISECIPSTSSPCELHPPQHNPSTGSLQYWISAGQPLEQDAQGNPHYVACSAFCECSLNWVLTHSPLSSGGACPVQDVQCTAPSVASLGYNSTHFIPLMCAWNAAQCQASPGDIFLRAPMPDPTSYDTLCYDANGRLPKLLNASSGVYYGVCGRTMATTSSESSPAAVSAACVDPITDTWIGGGSCPHVCNVTGFSCPVCECAGSCRVGSTCRVTQPACLSSGGGESLFDPTANAYIQPCNICQCADQTSCAYNEALGLNTCLPATSCWDTLLGFVSATGNASCEITSCLNSTAENFACFTGLCNSTQQQNEPCSPRYCECEGPCVVTVGKVTGTCKVVGDLPCIQPPLAADLRFCEAFLEHTPH
jgi:hypothetical protein